MFRRVLDPYSIIHVQTWESQPAPSSKVQGAWAVTWPEETGGVVSGPADIICTGPTDWFVIGNGPDSAALLTQLDKAFEGSSFRATNVSQGLVRIEIDGPRARDLLTKGCGLDLHPSRFPPGRCARTRFAGIPVIVRCIRESTFECMVASSYADYLLSWLNDVALEYGTPS
jgi:sarcosine oxidase subunit gamma